MFSAITLAFMDNYEESDFDTKMVLGWIIFFANIVLIITFMFRIFVNFMVFGYMILKMVLRLIIRKIRGSQKNQNIDKKEEDRTIMQQIIEIENFLR